MIHQSYRIQQKKDPAVRRAKRIRIPSSKSKANLSKRPKGVNDAGACASKSASGALASAADLKARSIGLMAMLSA